MSDRPATRRTLYAVIWWDAKRGDHLPLTLGQLFGPFKTATIARRAAKELALEGREGVWSQVVRLGAWWKDDESEELTLSYDRLLDNTRLGQLTRENKALKARILELEEGAA